MTQVGNTSYSTLPFASSIFAQSWASSPTLAPANLFWQAGKNFNSPATMANARADAAAKSAHGIVPTSGAQRWDDTYAAAQPPVPNEPSYITADRASLIASGENACFTAWAKWIAANAELLMGMADGTVNKNGHISPLTPLSSKQWPAGLGATYGDLFASQWAQTAKLSGAYGVVLSDYSDSQPIGPSYLAGFTTSIMQAFASKLGITIPGATPAQCASYITTHYLSAWTDFLCTGYARFFATLATDISVACGTGALVVDQCGLTPAQRRLYGVDARCIAGKMSGDNIITLWDNQTYQLGRSGALPLWGLSGAVLAAAREPTIRNGANLECDTPAFWQAVTKFSNVAPADQHEFGLKLLKRNWLEHAFSHIADMDGNCRRALAFMSRDYWDVGSLDATLAKLIQSIIPTRPFGLAVYYSTECEEAAEQGVPTAGLTSAYMDPSKLLAYKQAGGLVGYYVSDFGLPSLQFAPSAWVVLDGTLGDSELRALRQFAPVLTGRQTIGWAAPLTMSPGLSGFAFYDQNGRLLVLVSNTTNVAVNAEIALAGYANASAVELFTGANVDISKPFQLARWESYLLGLSA